MVGIKHERWLSPYVIIAAKITEDEAQHVIRSPVSRNLRRSATSMSLLAVHVTKSSPVSMGGDFASGVKICGRCSSALMGKCSLQHHSTNLSCTPVSKSS